MIETLTKEQDALCDEIAEEYIRDLTQPTIADGEAITKWLDLVYGMYNLKRPERIELAESPAAALLLATDLTGQAQTSMDWCGVGDGGWVAFYDYFRRIGVLSADEATDLITYRDFCRVAWDMVLLDECAIIVQRPTVLRVDDAGSLHCATGPCIEWGDGEKDYAWHGTWVSERIVMDPLSYTRAEYLAITNTEERRALSESGGWAWVAGLLGADVINTWTDPKTGLGYDLMRCGDRSQLLNKKSPPLKDGAQPDYLEPVHEELKTAQAARKWQATTLTPAQCEADPALSYGVEA